MNNYGERCITNPPSMRAYGQTDDGQWRPSQSQQAGHLTSPMVSCILELTTDRHFDLMCRMSAWKYHVRWWGVFFLTCC